MNLINQYSYLLIGLGAMAGCFLVLRNRTSLLITAATQIALLALFTIVYVLIRPEVDSVDDLEAASTAIGNGRPTLLAFYSDYCALCITLNPVVDQIAGDIQGEFNVLRVNIHTTVGRALRDLYGFSFTPEFVLYDASGAEVWRDHVPPTADDLNAARSSS
jgi:thiol-disulfide isomerase/thioredoxin